MKVAQLKALIENLDDEEEVLIGVQPSYPFEHKVFREITRSDFEQENEDYEVTKARDSKHPNDVIILVGDQVRYGSHAMWG